MARTGFSQRTRGVSTLCISRADLKRLTGILKLPSHNAVPLIDLQRQIAVTLNPLKAKDASTSTSRCEKCPCERQIGEYKPAHFGVVRIHDSLGRRSDRNVLLKFRFSAEHKTNVISVWQRKGVRMNHSRPCDPCYLRCKSFDVILFSFKNPRRDKHWEIRIFNAERFDALVKPTCIASISCKSSQMGDKAPVGV